MIPTYYHKNISSIISGYINNSITYKKSYLVQNLLTFNFYQNENWIKNKVISLEKLLKENKCINLDRELVQKFFNGVKLKYNGPDGIYKIYFDNEFLGTGIVKEKSLKRDIIVISEKY